MAALLPVGLIQRSIHCIAAPLVFIGIFCAAVGRARCQFRVEHVQAFALLTGVVQNAHQRNVKNEEQHSGNEAVDGHIEKEKHSTKDFVLCVTHGTVFVGNVVQFPKQWRVFETQQGEDDAPRDDLAGSVVQITGVCWHTGKKKSFEG